MYHSALLNKDRNNGSKSTIFLKSLASVAAATSISCKGGDKPQDTASVEPTPQRTPEPPRWAPAGDEDLDLFPYGVQVGDVSEGTAIVSVQSNSPVIENRVMIEDGDAWAQHDALLDVPVVDGFAQVTLTDLPDDTAVCVAAFTPQTTGRSAVTRFRTAIGNEGWRVLQFGVTSCLGGNFPWPSLSAAAAYELDDFYLFGDSVYADGSVSSEQYWVYWRILFLSKACVI